MSALFPPETLCDYDGCGHRHDAHVAGAFPDVPMPCVMCEENARRGFEVPGRHRFIPRKLAGGALTPSAEREAYERALRGE